MTLLNGILDLKGLFGTGKGSTLVSYPVWKRTGWNSLINFKYNVVYI